VEGKKRRTYKNYFESLDSTPFAALFDEEEENLQQDEEKEPKVKKEKRKQNQEVMPLRPQKRGKVLQKNRDNKQKAKQRKRKMNMLPKQPSTKRARN